jgi:hypothetical protein
MVTDWEKITLMIDSKMGSVRRGVFKAFAQTGAAIISSFPN